MTFYNNMASSFDQVHDSNRRWDNDNNIQGVQDIRQNNNLTMTDTTNENIHEDNSSLNINNNSDYKNQNNHNINDTNNNSLNYREKSILLKEEVNRINGRVNILNTEPVPSFPLFNQGKQRFEKYSSEALRGIQILTPLSSSFFSKQNINDIQNMIRYNIWILSNREYIIGRQSEVDLHLVMRSTYLQYSQNMPTNIKKQIKYLNTLVLDWCIPRIFSEVEQFMAYRKNVSALPKPIERSVNMSISGTKTLELKNFM